VPAIGANPEPIGESDGDQSIEERADILAVPDAGKGFVLPTQQ
jgi:hypothetical protein